MSVRDQIAVLEKLADRVGRLCPPMNSHPHRFHEQRSDLRKDIRAVAQWVLTGRKPSKLESDDERDGRDHG